MNSLMPTVVARNMRAAFVASCIAKRRLKGELCLQLVVVGVGSIPLWGRIKGSDASAKCWTLPHVLSAVAPRALPISADLRFSAIQKWFLGLGIERSLDFSNILRVSSSW
jgi:hypothetical protein